MNIKLSVVIPCYNEEQNLPLLLAKLSGAIHRPDIEVILVNNGSKDGSQAELERLLTGHPFARSVLVEVNQGYGFGILAGLKNARGEFLAWTHADMQTDPADLVKALELAESRPFPRRAFVKGARKGRPLFDEIFTFGMGVFETIYFGKSLWDINAQPNLFHRDLFETWSDPPHDFSLDLFALHSAKSAGWDVVRFPVLFPPRIHGASSWNTGMASKWKFIKRTVDYSRRLKACHHLRIQ
jgi:polyisoprenyl-phosphate glycosyltransferase